MTICWTCSDNEKRRGALLENQKALRLFYLVRLPMAYFMSIQPNASLTSIGLAAPASTVVGVCLSIGCYLYMDRSRARQQA